MRDIEAEREYSRIQGNRRDEYFSMSMDYADGKISKYDLDAWLAENPIDMSGFDIPEPSRQREPHGGNPYPCLDRFQ